MLCRKLCALSVKYYSLCSSYSSTTINNESNKLRFQIPFSQWYLLMYILCLYVLYFTPNFSLWQIILSRMNLNSTVIFVTNDVELFLSFADFPLISRVIFFWWIPVSSLLLWRSDFKALLVREWADARGVCRYRCRFNTWVNTRGVSHVCGIRLSTERPLFVLLSDSW